ncbi:MAG: phosphoribosylglycinamide formyltransferase [Chloroflexia bacterium]
MTSRSLSDAPTHGLTDAQPRLLRIGLLASHGGSNLGAIVASCHERRIAAEPVVVIGNNSDAFALERARRAGIPVYHLSTRTHPDPDALDAAIAAALARYEVDLVVLAGYMKRLGPRVLDRWRGRIINVHPSLLPDFGGQGMYGARVHEAVLAAGVTVTGVTIHLVTEEYDQGPTLAQRQVPVLPGDTAESLAARVLPEEHALYVETIGRIARGDIALPVADGAQG